MNFVIDDFNGPLDLLLHLVKEKKMNLLDIKLEIIIDEYLEFIHKMEEINLTVASSYLVMASELIELKSKMLLPKSENEENEEDDNTEENLIRRLEEYEKYKEVTDKFKELEEERKDIFTKLPENIQEYREELLSNSDVTIEDLVDALKKLLERKEHEKPLNTKVIKDEISIKERVESIKNILKMKKKVSFNSLFEVASKDYVVATFLAILEMCKNNELRLTQDDRFGEITCEVYNG